MNKLSYETAVTIQAPVQQIYSYLADFPRHVEWNYQPQELIPLTEGPVRVGSRYRTKEEDFPSKMPTMQRIMMSIMVPIMKKIYGAESFTIAEITALEPNTRIAWTAHAPTKKGKMMMRIHWEIRLQPDNGATVVTQSCVFDPPADSPVAKMVNKDMAELGRAEVTENLARLKSLVESQKQPSAQHAITR